MFINCPALCMDRWTVEVMGGGMDRWTVEVMGEVWIGELWR